MTPRRAVWLVLTHRARAFVPAWVRAGWWPPLPGGWGARRWTRVPGWVDNGLAPALAAAISTMIAWRLGRQGEELIVVAGVVLVAVRLVPVVRPAPVRDRHVARRADHPVLLAAVAEVADELGVRRPSRVCFAPVAESGGTRLGPRRTELWIGLDQAPRPAADPILSTPGLTVEWRSSWPGAVRSSSGSTESGCAPTRQPGSASFSPFSITTCGCRATGTVRRSASENSSVPAGIVSTSPGSPRRSSRATRYPR
ncbi:hypothetical protein [Microbispora sp. H10670]|uniref:hypothetical protein n=1 Tax=Microbispora sp. H10670 TaxID=2729108 RepID=UPI001600C845|nr:hypothetical protein [Microbispora sp. H10670]